MHVNIFYIKGLVYIFYINVWNIYNYIWKQFNSCKAASSTPGRISSVSPASTSPTSATRHYLKLSPTLLPFLSCCWIQLDEMYLYITEGLLIGVKMVFFSKTLLNKISKNISFYVICDLTQAKWSICHVSKATVSERAHVPQLIK